MLGEIADGIPPEWYNDEYEKLGELLRGSISGAGGFAS